MPRHTVKKEKTNIYIYIYFQYLTFTKDNFDFVPNADESTLLYADHIWALKVYNCIQIYKNK